LIDEEAAEIVRYIFRLCAESFGPSQIAKRLRKEKVLTPTAYKKQKKEKCCRKMLNDLIDKILVHAPDRSNGQRTQKIEIYYKAVGVIEIPDLDECIAAKLKQKDSKMTA